MKKKDHLVTNHDRKILRALAKEVRLLADQPIEKIKAKNWTDLNELRSSKPLVLANPENSWHEIITKDMLMCETPLGRQWEEGLRRTLYRGQVIKDDSPINSVFSISHSYSDTGWGVEIIKESTGDGGAYHINPPIKVYEEDFSKLKFPELVIDYEATKERTLLAESVFEGLLRVENKTNWWWSLGMTWDYIDLRGLDHFMMDMILEPEWVHKMMTFLTEGYEKRLDFLEKEGLLYPNWDGSPIASGGYGFSEQLGQRIKDYPVKLEDMWGFAESQETVGVSPEMFAHFILPYQIRLLKKFRRNAYGCCEPIDGRWDYVKTIPRLRRVSASPWADKVKMASQLGNDYIISVKPSPMPLASNPMKEDIVRKELREAIVATKGHQVEFIMKDTHTLGNNPQNIIRWVEIAREEIEAVY